MKHNDENHSIKAAINIGSSCAVMLIGWNIGMRSYHCIDSVDSNIATNFGGQLAERVRFVEKRYEK